MDRREFIKTGSFATLNMAVLGSSFGTTACQTTTCPSFDRLAASFDTPPAESLAGCYWWWFNGVINKAGITRDLEEFRDKGINDVLLVNSAGNKMPVGVQFLSEEWKALYRHALSEAKRLRIQVGVNLCSGWCMGGPWITPEMAGRWFLQSELRVEGTRKFSGKLPLPGNRSGYDNVFNPPGLAEYIDLPLEELDYRDTAVVAFPLQDETHSQLDEERKKWLPAKSNRRDASNWTPAWEVMGPALERWKNHPGDCPVAVNEVINLTDKMSADGHLEWDIPAGQWVIVRTGHRMTGSRLSIAQPEADGLSVAWLNSEGVDMQFEKLGKILLAEAEKVGFSLHFFCDDSFEDGFPNWTAAILERFQYYRGYDATPYLPVLRGYIVGSAEISDRFLHDYRKTVADCMADGHYKRFAELCHQNGLLVQNESAGPSRSGTMCMDALKNLGRSDLPSGEFWLGIKHDEPGGLTGTYGPTRLERGQNKVTKMVSSAAHIYGKNLVAAEAYTTYRHWSDSPASLKQSTDRAFCEGVNRLMIHTSTATCPEDGLPGYEYYAGTHFNPNVTWWNQSGGFLTYIGRCQHLLRQGHFVADVLFYNGDHAPNIVEPKHVHPSLGKGYDYDVCNEEVLLTRLSVKNGLLVLPDGMSYRLLALPDTRNMPEPVMAKIEALAAQGATIAGTRPEQDPGLKNYPRCDTSVRELAAKVWGKCDGENITENKYRKGRIYWGKDLRDILVDDGVLPDFEYTDKGAVIDFIHRTVDDCEIYFVANLENRPEQTTCTFRVTGRQPEIWNPVTGEKLPVTVFSTSSGRTTIPMEFAGFQSFFVVFPEKTRSTGQPVAAKSNFPALHTIQVIDGKWDVFFDPRWLGAGRVAFDQLEDWTGRPEEGIKYYSGKATYRKKFDLSETLPAGTRIWLDLGEVRNIAEVRLNGADHGVVWTNPWRVDITAAVRPKDNELEIDVVNLWPNRLIGDAALPVEARVTNTNIVFKKDDPLLPSGLLGPVTLAKQEI